VKCRWSTLAVSALLLTFTAASADDGDKVVKRMSHNAKLTVAPEEVGETVAEAEHAFIDMMGFYVPSQAADGTPMAVDYVNADGGAVETLSVAKPLVGVFIYGPAIGVEGTAFAHSFMDAYAAVSLDDGMTWKPTNLSESADQSSFRLGELTTLASSHDDDDDGHHDTSTLTIFTARWTDEKGGTLEAEGKDAPPKTAITIINSLTKEELAKTRSDQEGEWEIEARLGVAPCMIAAVADGEQSPAMMPEDTPEECDGGAIMDYPGGVYNIFHATVGNKVLVAWPSRYCEQGKPAYSLPNDVEDMDAVVNFIVNGSGDSDVPALPGFTAPGGDFDTVDDLYLTDVFGVAGSQKSSDFADEGYPQAGEVPFGCVWTARGVLLPGDDPRTEAPESSHMVWTKPERLTSGRRDPFRIEVKGVAGEEGTLKGGFAITWQEDPEGLRPGQGEGPGEGWSGAVAHHKTDVWYSFINLAYFDYVQDEDGSPVNIAEHDLTLSGRPKAFVPLAIPMRLTNNDKCKLDENGEIVDTALYCRYDYADSDTDALSLTASDFFLKDQCESTVEIPTGPNDDLTPICVSEDGLPNIANTAATRPRLSVQPSATGNAWVVVAAEESKGLGSFFSLPNGMPCEEGSSLDCQEEIGKNQWYYTFDMGTPDTSADISETSLVRNLVSQGNMLNQPEIDWRTGEFYPPIDPYDVWGIEANFVIYQTEIARRSSLLVQSTAKAGSSGLVAISSFKQGPMRQGGPADTMLRRFVDHGESVNPYAFTNMVCDDWSDPSPYYPNGVCRDPATNLSSVVPDTCIDTATGGDIPCPSVDFTSSTFGIGDTNPILQGYEQQNGNTMKVLTWHQCPSAATIVADSLTTDPVDCASDDRIDQFVNLKDQSWYNPLDVSKGHRGFLDGDMVMFLYAWSPNWRLNAKGSDRYDLYVRRSFDGGETWSTLPESFLASNGESYSGDGTVTCETYRALETGSGDIVEPQACFDYPAGGAEQARNVTQHSAMRTTTLDPRYAPTAGTIEAGCVSDADPTIDITVMTCDDLSAYDSDVRDPSRYFMVFETGDNTTVEEGEAEPLDLFYSRAINFGDDYVVWAEDADLTECYPSDPHEDEQVSDVVIGSGFCNEFDRANSAGDSHSSEADLASNPDGSKLYGVWAQWAFDASGEEVIESDAIARRFWWIEDYIPSTAWIFGQGTGDGIPAN
jgi:hypothetical protein